MDKPTRAQAEAIRHGINNSHQPGRIWHMPDRTIKVMRDNGWIIWRIVLQGDNRTTTTLRFEAYLEEAREKLNTDRWKEALPLLNQVAIMDRELNERGWFVTEKGREAINAS